MCVAQGCIKGRRTANISKMAKGTQEEKNASTFQLRNQQENTQTSTAMSEISRHVTDLGNRVLVLEGQMEDTISQLDQIDSEIKSTITCRSINACVVRMQSCMVVRGRITSVMRFRAIFCHKLGYRVCFKPAPIEGKTYVNVLGCGYDHLHADRNSIACMHTQAIKSLTNH